MQRKLFCILNRYLLVICMPSLGVVFTSIHDCRIWSGWLASFCPRIFIVIHNSKGFIPIPFPNKPWLLRVHSTSLLKTLWEKEKLLVMCNFFFSHSVFYPFGRLSAIFIKLEIVTCKLLEFGRV